MNKPDVLIIGAGLGGIALAARLAHRGHAVTVLEKNPGPGGRCGQILHEGHRFDIGPTLFLMPEVFAETYASLGECLENHLDLIRIDPTYRVRFSDGVGLTLTGDLNRMQPQLEAIEPGSFGGYLAYLNEGYRHYRLSLDRFVGRNFYSLLDYFSPANLPLLFKLKALVKHYDNIGRYFRDPHLKAAFTFQNMYLGLSPYDAPATYSLLQYTELADGVWFPRGGLYAVIESFARIAEQNGVQFCFNTPVEAIEVSGGRASGVRLASGERLSAKIIIANADLPYVYRSLLPDAAPRRQMERKQYTCSTLTYYWAVDKPCEAIDMHNVFLAGDYRQSFERIFHDLTLPAEPSFYVHAPARVDPTAAPPGRDTLMVLVPVGRLSGDGRQDWDALKARARAWVLERLAHAGAPDLDEHITYEATYTPHTWQRLCNLENGAAFGLSHNFTQVGYLRPHNRHPRYSNLYFCGSSTHPGTGLPMVLLSARLVAERIAHEHGG